MERAEEILRVRTPEHVGFEYVLAGLGSRATAVLWDMLIRFVLVLFLFVVISLLLRGVPILDPTGDLTDLSTNWILAAGILAYGVIELGYFLICETLMNGQTPGKRIQNIRVIRMNGQPIGFMESAIRNVLRAVDVLFGIYPLGLLVMFLSPRYQRIGDYAAGTLVIKEKRTAASMRPESEDGPLVVQIPDIALHVSTVTPAEYRLLKNFLQRRNGMDRPNRSQLARTLALRLMGRWGISPRSELPYESFLQEVVTVYERSKRAL